MAKVTGPLHSSIASGDFAEIIQYVCGHFARMKPRTKDKESEEQTTQRNKFIEGANTWKTLLSTQTKNNWKRSAGILLKTRECIGLDWTLTGYNFWMFYWLKYGGGGWSSYPNPPF